MKTALAFLALVLSALSLGLQLSKPKPVPPLEKYLVPARITDLEERLRRAEIGMIRESLPMQEGIGVPFVKEISPDHQHIIVRVMLDEGSRPKAYDQRKEAFHMKGIEAVGTLASELEMPADLAERIVVVEFLSISDLVKGNQKRYAEFTNGQLTFH